MKYETMITKKQAHFVLKLDEDDAIYINEQHIWTYKSWFYRNVSYLIRSGFVRGRRDYNKRLYLYTLTTEGKELAVLLKRFLGVRF